MEKQKDEVVRNTADTVAVARFLESKKANPLIDDPFAHLFISPQGEAILEQALKRWPFFLEYLMVRSRFFDDWLKNFVLKENAHQILILGAGNDMRASRLPFLHNRRVFEIDFPEKINAKKAILQHALNALPENVEYLQCDLRQVNLAEILERHGFKSKEKSAIIMEGLLYYVGKEGVDSIFENVAFLPETSNLFLLDHITGDMQKEHAKSMKTPPPPYPEDPVEFLQKRGFTIQEAVFLGDLTKRYLGRGYKERWWAIAARR